MQHVTIVFINIICFEGGLDFFKSIFLKYICKNSKNFII